MGSQRRRHAASTGPDREGRQHGLGVGGGQLLAEHAPDPVHHPALLLHGGHQHGHGCPVHLSPALLPPAHARCISQTSPMPNRPPPAHWLAPPLVTHPTRMRPSPRGGFTQSPSAHISIRLVGRARDANSPERGGEWWWGGRQMPLRPAARRGPAAPSCPGRLELRFWYIGLGGSPTPYRRNPVPPVHTRPHRYLSGGVWSRSRWRGFPSHLGLTRRGVRDR